MKVMLNFGSRSVDSVFASALSDIITKYAFCMCLHFNDTLVKLYLLSIILVRYQVLLVLILLGTSKIKYILRKDAKKYICYQVYFFLQVMR